MKNNYIHLWPRLWLFIILISLCLPPFANADDDDNDEENTTKFSIKKSTYKAKNQQLKIKLKIKGEEPYKITVFDDKTDKILLTKNTNDDSVNLKLKHIQGKDVPCVIRVEVNQNSQTKEVKKAPDNCSGSVVEDESENEGDEDSDDDGHDDGHDDSPDPTPPSPPAPNTNRPPVCDITQPATNTVNIALGDSIVFTGSASDPDGDNLSFEWDFNGAADKRPLVLNPGSIQFDVNNGQFLIHFLVTDELGSRCTASRTIIVGTVNPNVPPSMVPQQPAPGSATAGDGQHVVLPANDLGMHCADLGSYPFNILPPFNTVNAHAILKGTTGNNKPLILDGSSVTLKYSAASNENDPVGPDSINSTSQNFPVGSQLADAVIRKTDFWDDFKSSGESIVELLFPGLHPVPDEGLLTLDNLDQGHGRYMPGISSPYTANIPQTFSGYIEAFGWHTAQGIPMSPVDDKGRLNSYPIMRVQAIDNLTGNTLATTDVVTPVSAEVDCRDCHTAGKVGADKTARINGPAFVSPASNDRLDVERAAKRNILLLHDFNHNTNFIADDKPVLCAGCHGSNALSSVGGPAGLPFVPSMSNVMHGYHGRLQTDSNDKLVRDFQGNPVLVDPVNSNNDTALIKFGNNVPMEQNCFLCHPGKITQCFRGAMYTAGQKCDSCHGDLLAVGAEFNKKDGTKRVPWAEEPRCGSCHTGIGSDGVKTIAYDPADPAAEPSSPETQRFAENPNTLYRNSLDSHANLGCESCHGSPHAIWPNRNPNANDNVTAMQLQGHTGTILECTTCHEDNSFPNGTLDGPHGMHPVNDPDWNDEDGHGHFAERNNAQCAACHGKDHLGTRLAKVPVDRVLTNHKGKVLVTLKAGDQVSCDLCHSLSKSFDD